MSKAREVAEIMSYTDAINTSSIEESGNLYFTNQRGIDSGSATYVLQTSQQGIINSASAAAVAYADALTTTDVAEGTDLYFTNERAVNSGSATYLTQSSASATYIPLSASASLGGGSEPNFSSVFMLGGM